MNKIQEKLKCNKGSSLILVLMLFFVCIMVSSVVVATATVGASRSAYRTEQQRAYLSMSSAAELVAEDMKNLLQNSFYEKIRVIEYGCNDVTLDESEAFLNVDTEITIGDVTVTYVGIPMHYDETSHYEVNGITGGLLGGVMATACHEIFLGDSSYEEEFYIYPHPEGVDERFSKVHCNFVMDAGYNITIVFSAEGTSQTLIMEFEATRIDDNGSPFKNETDFTCAHNIIYDDNKTVRSRYYPGKETIYETEIRWGSPSVTRGAE